MFSFGVNLDASTCRAFMSAVVNATAKNEFSTSDYQQGVAGRYKDLNKIHKESFRDQLYFIKQWNRTYEDGLAPFPAAGLFVKVCGYARNSECKIIYQSDGRPRELKDLLLCKLYEVVKDIRDNLVPDLTPEEYKKGLIYLAYLECDDAKKPGLLLTSQLESSPWFTNQINVSNLKQVIEMIHERQAQANQRVSARL